MAVKRIGRGFIIAGIVGIVLSVLISIFLDVRLRIQSTCILGIEISVIVILLGVWLARREAEQEIQPRSSIRDFAKRMLALPVFVWVLSGFLLVYGSLFLAPIFLNPNLQMSYFSGYIPNLNPIGNDLTVMMNLARDWINLNQSPYTIQFYPPLTYLIFAPLLLIQDPLVLYRVFTLFTFFSYFLLTLLLPLQIIDRKHLPLAVLLFVTGLFSYGFQFELERGQYNVFTFLLCLTSIYVFHYHPRYRLLAYLLFSISVQLKLYPAIFIFMFVDDWREWKKTLLRFAGIGVFNLLLLFVMGHQIFWDFIRSVSAQVLSPSWIGVWNHSISSFVSVFKQDGLGLISFETLRTFRHNAEWAQAVLLLSFLVLFLSNLIIFHRRNKTGLDPYLLLACTTGALILPISYDYTLSILTVPVLLLLSQGAEGNRPIYRSLTLLLILGISVAYFSLLIPFNYRPYVLSNAFPLLFLIFILATLLNIFQYKNEAGHETALSHA